MLVALVLLILSVCFLYHDFATDIQGISHGSRLMHYAYWTFLLLTLDFCLQVGLYQIYNYAVYVLVQREERSRSAIAIKCLPSVTLVYCDKTTDAKITRSLLESSVISQLSAR